MGVVGVFVGSRLCWLCGSPPGARFVTLPIGGDCGGSMRTEGGGFNGLGLNGGFPVRGERGSAAKSPPFFGTCNLGILSPSLGFGLPSSCGAGAAPRPGLVSGTGGGFGEGILNGGAAGKGVVAGVAGASLPLPRFSNLALREETGLSEEPSGPSPPCGSIAKKEF
jgi:hypothetical protein